VEQAAPQLSMDFLMVCPPEGTSVRQDLGGGTVRIGRAHACNVLLKDLNVSRLHAEIVRRPDGFYVIDLGGKNGTFVNEERITEPTLLRPGDRVRVGTTTLIFNGSATSSIEIIDRPLPEGGATTFLPAHEISTPARATSAPGIDAGRAGTVRSRSRSTPAAAAAAEGAELSAELNIIFEADKELVFHRPVEDLLQKIMDLAQRAAPFERGVLMLLEKGEPAAKVIRVPPQEAERGMSISRTILEHVVRKQESVLTSDATIDERFREGRSVEVQHIRSVMCVPLWNNREVIGLIYLDSRRSAGLFTPETLRVLAHLANVAAVKIENARLFEQAVDAEAMHKDLERAAEIQAQLLPAGGPAVRGYQIDGRTLSCRAVGGDYFDYIELPGGRMGIALGDVAGKGLSAALLMCTFQATLRTFSELDLPLEETLQRLNRQLCRRIPANRYVTFFYGILDPATHALTYANAGHNPVLLLRADGAPERLGVTSQPLGLFENLDCKAGRIDLARGDVMLCYSDGITEALGPAEEEFGEERLAGVVRDCRDCPTEEIVQRILNEVDRHHAGVPRQDDLTLVALKRV
jgi:serine phosphatase RsbU (regulator of sigma subunit)/pSer/pThr/pTyr-binding forkhead associated (FHA) protein